MRNVHSCEYYKVYHLRRQLQLQAFLAQYTFIRVVVIVVVLVVALMAEMFMQCHHRRLLISCKG